MSGIGDGNSLKASGFMARVGAGGGVTGFGGTSASTMDGSSAIQFADAVEITANGRGNIQIGSVNQWQSNQLTHLGTGGVINGAGIQSTLESNLSNAVDIGSNVSLIAPGGEIGIGTSSNSVTTSNADSYTFGLAGGSSSDSSNNMTSKQTLTIGNSSVLHAGRDIVITTGYDPRTKTESLLDAYAIVTARCAGLLEIPGTTADAVLNADNTLSIGTGTIISHGDIEIGALPGINNASWYTFANMDGAKGKVHQGTDGLTESNSVTIDSDVYAGNNNTLSIDIPASGQQINVNGSGNQAITEEALEIKPSDAFATSGAFLPFQVSYNPDYDATQLLAGLDDTSKAILEPSISKQSVTAVTLTDLVAVGGQVVLHAADLQGSGTITANMPGISITNESDAYLLLDGVGNANTLNMGQVNVVGGGTKPSGMTFTQNKDVPAIVVLQTYGQAVGDSTSGPAIALNDAMVNTAGSVQITNDMGALVQTAPINAQTVSISTPNSAYIVSTPADYYGSSGEIKDYWTAGTSLTQDGGFESPSTGTYVYNPPGSNWTFSSSSGVSANDSGFTSGNSSAPQGDQVAFLQMQGEISQSMGSMTGGATYVLQFDSAQRAGYPDQSFDIALDGNQLCQITPTSTDYESYSCTFEVPTTELANQDTLVLTDGLSSTATAFWHQDQLELPTSGSIAIDFTYQSGGNKEADGIALAFQTQGVDVIGAVGGSLGYVGIPGPTAAYQINLYNGHVQGSNFVTTNTSETYLETSPVSFNSGNPIRVQLVYDVDTSVVTESLTDLETNATFARTYENVDLRSVLGSKTYVGFTGADGGATSTQTVSDFSLTVGDADQTPVMQGFGNWEINGDVNRVLTLTGLEPTGQDETVFLDNMVLATNPDGFMPGLNSYVQEYTANLAATTAANDLYLEESGASLGLQFSKWLYNQGGQSINMNYDVSPGNPGSNYPKNANHNFDSEQHGNGTIFFGSEIPYLWNQATSVSSGSGYLYDGLGYLDNLSNAQTYSIHASGNSSDEYKNVTQGTGPQHDNVSPGRGVFPVVPASFPTSVSVSEPGSRSLGGSGITAGSLDVTALFLDINGPIKVGALKQSIDLVLGSNLQDSMDSYQQDFKSGSITSPTMDLDTYFGTSGMTGYFDASSGEIVINPYAVTAGLAKAVFTGAIISTTGLGEITVQSDPGEINIDNQTDYPLVLENISAASQELGGVVLLNDTITNTATGFVYSTDESVRVYQGELHSDLDSMTLVTTTTGDAISFQPGSDQPYVAGSVSPSSLAYQWTTDAWISRELTFNVNSSGGYDLSAGSTSDAWHWGRLRGASQNTEVESSPFPSVNTVLLSDGQADDSNAYWHPTKLDVPETGQFTVQFTYQASGDKAADGITFAFQNEGANALGGVGGALGYVGISGPTAAYQINLYSGHTQGSNFIVTNASGTYLTTDEVSFNDGNPVEVTLVYDGDAKTVSESLTDTVTLATYTHVYDNIDLTAVLGASSYFGFTGGDGGATSIQTVSDFSLTLGTSSTPQVKDFALWNGLYHQDVVSLSTSGMENSNALQSVTAIITQSESATTTFSGDNSDAWNYGPSTTWDWSYPTEILLRNFNQVPAANPISIDFSGVQYGSLTVESDSDLRLAGNVIFPGTVSLSSAENVTQVPNAVVNATRVDFTSSEGSIGQEGLPIQVSVDSSSVINANASDGIYLSSKNELVLGQIITSSGQVGLESDGDLTAGEGNSMIAGDNISLMAENGSIGSQARPLTIQTKTSQLKSGTVIGGLLSAAAKDSVFVVQPESDLRLLSVTTSSSLGVVSITNQSGSITDGNTSDVFELNQFTLEQAEFLIQQINIVQQNTAETTVTAFEAAVDQSYLQYWTMVPSQGAVDEQTGEFVLNADGLAYYKAQAALYYAAESGDESPGPVTDEQIQSYGNLLYQNSVAVFADSLVFGNAWPTLSQFQSYDPDYTYEVSSGVRDTLTYGANDLSNSLAILSLDALSPVGTAVLGPISPAIQTTVLDLNAGGAIGVPFHVLEIDYSNFQNGTLNDEEVAVLAQATSSGELRFVGLNPSGERVEYSYGSRPEGVTPVAVIVRIDKPLFVDLAVNGLTQVQAQESINLTEAVGDLNILYAEGLYDVKLVSQVNVLNTQLAASSAEPGWSVNANGVLGYTNSELVYQATDLSLSGPLFQMGVIDNGSFEEPVQSAGGFTYNPATTSWDFSVNDSGISSNGSGFTNANPNAPLGSQVGLIQEQGVISQSIDGLVLGQSYNLQFDVAQRANYPVPTFTVELDGQELTTQSPASTSYQTVSVPFVMNTSSLELTDGQDNEANAYWYQQPLLINDSAQFSVEFTYQASGDAAADGITFAFQKEGTQALGAAGGSLGYVGITGPTAAYQINLYDGHVRGSNFVMTNSSQNYLVTGPINFNSGNPIQVQLVFDVEQQTVIETLTDAVQQTSFTRTYDGVDLATLLSESAYIGFTGGDGGASSTQNVSDFKLWRGEQNDSPILSGFGGWQFTGQHLLTLTGVDPSLTDQTAFVDGIKITRSPGIIAGDLRLVSGGAVGTPASPLSVQVGGELDVYATDDLNLSHQSSNNLRLHAIYSGGDATIEAPLSNIFAVENEFTGSVTGFGTDGNGQNWIEDAVNGSATFSSGNLLMANEAAPVDASETWHSTAATQFNSPGTVENRFISSFVYQSSSSDAALEFVLAPEGSNLTTLVQTGDTQGTDTFALVIETPCEDCATSQAIGVRLGEQLQTIAVPDDIGLGSGDPIQVVMIYETLTKTVSVTLKNAGNSFTSDVTDVDLLKLLGTNRAQLGFVAQGNGQASSQTISGFNFVYGAPTIEAYELEITSGLQIGGTNTPVRILVLGDVRAAAPNGVYLTQIDGNLMVDSVNSEGTVQLAAPLGSVAGAGSSNPADSSLLLGAEGSGSADNVARVQAGQLRLSSLNHIGAVDTELEIGASSLAATTVLGDINLAQFGNLSVDGGVQAGGAVRVTGDSHIAISSIVHANQEVDLRSEGGAGNLHLLPDAHFFSANGLLNLFADGAVIAELGSRLESSGHVTVATGSAALNAAIPHRIRLLGSINGGRLQLTSGSANDSAELSITDLKGMAGNPLAVTISQFETLHLDDTRASSGRAYEALQDRINTDVAELQVGEVRSVVMNLGAGDDSFQSQALTLLSSLEMHGNGGVDHFDLAAFAGGSGLAVKVMGGESDDQLHVDGLGTPVWMVDGTVHAGDLHIDHGDVEKVLLQNAVDGLPAEQIEQLEFDALSFPGDRLLLLGTAGDDDWFMSLSPTGIQVDGVWNETEHLRRSFDGINYREVVFELLAGDDSLLVNGGGSHSVVVDGAEGNDWIYVDKSDAMVTDLHGNNHITTGTGADEIHTGSGKDKINAGDGQNVIHDAGGMNWIVTGMLDDSIYHENADDFISASDGINKIWLNGELQGWHNTELQTDVNRDSNTTALDVLLIINRLAIVGTAGEDGRYFFAGSADSLNKLYDANADGYMSTLDCIFVLNALSQAADGGEGEINLEFVPLDGIVNTKPSTGVKDQQADECFANWDEQVPLLIAPPQSQSDLLQAWEHEDMRRMVELESILEDLEQSADGKFGLGTLQSSLMRTS
ncbi:dockerin type I domain-containing protein [bacterium]|nr:dockerin type I domain-containing protein [bacterium]